MKNIQDLIEKATQTLDYIEEFIAKSELSLDIERLSQDMLQLTCNDSSVYLLNVSSARGEIWLSSPLSGAYHFSYSDGIWKTSRGQELQKTLIEDLESAFSVPTEENKVSKH